MEDGKTWNKKRAVKIYLHLLDKYHDMFHVHLSHKYICINSKDIGDYVGHAFAINTI